MWPKNTAIKPQFWQLTTKVAYAASVAIAVEKVIFNHHDEHILLQQR